LNTSQKIVLASSNSGKLGEINKILSGLDLEVLPQSEFRITDAEETGVTFIDNAMIKAKHATMQTGLPAIADDSGIEIDGLNGAPGVFSARYAGVGASDEDNLLKLIEAVKRLPENNRTARFVCCMVYLRNADDPSPVIAEGIWEGVAITEPKGENGFGYDPMFYVPTHHCTSAELPPDVKNELSHRGQALRLLLKKLSAMYTDEKG